MSDRPDMQGDEQTVEADPALVDALLPPIDWPEDEDEDEEADDAEPD